MTTEQKVQEVREEVKTQELLNRLEEIKRIKEAITFNLPTKHFKIINNSIHEMIDDVLEESKELNRPFKIINTINKIIDIKIKFSIRD